MDWCVSGDTIETLEFRESSTIADSSPDSASEELEEEPGLFDELMIAFRQWCEAGEKLYVSVVSRVPWSQQPLPQAADCCVMEKGEREIQLTDAVERELHLVDAGEREIQLTDAVERELQLIDAVRSEI